MSHYMYNEWWEKVDAGIHCLQQSPQSDFLSVARRITASGSSHLSHQDGEVLDECQQLTAHSSWTVPMSHYMYNE
eukprot:scaffold27236_cov60-Cyclotella_meneghiniana.AAC.1